MIDNCHGTRKCPHRLRSDKLLRAAVRIQWRTNSCGCRLPKFFNKASRCGDAVAQHSTYNTQRHTPRRAHHTHCSHKHTHTPTSAQFRAHHGTDPRRTRPASHEPAWDRACGARPAVTRRRRQAKHAAPAPAADAAPIPGIEHVPLAPAGISAPVIEFAASEPPVTDTALAPMFAYVAQAPAIAHATPVRVFEYVAALAVTHAAPAPEIEHAAVPLFSYAPPAPVIEHMAALAVTSAAPAPLIEYVRSQPAVVYTAPVPVIEHVALAPAVIFEAAAPMIEHGAAAHSSPKRAKKSSRSKRPHHHDDDDLLLSEATDHEWAVMREEIRIMLAADLHRCPSRHRVCMSSSKCGSDLLRMLWTSSLAFLSRHLSPRAFSRTFGVTSRKCYWHGEIRSFTSP